MSDKPKVYEEFLAVMREVSGVAKRDRNEHQRFNFRGIDAVVNALGPAFREHGLIVVPRVADIEHTDIRTSQGKPATRCIVTVDYQFIGSDGSSITATSVGEAFDSGDKATPKAMSVAFRTCLLQTFILPTDEPDPDAQTYERADPPLANGEQMQEIGRLLTANGLIGDAVAPARLAAFKEAIGRDTTGGDLLADEAGRVIEHLQGLVSLAEKEKMLQESLGGTPVAEPGDQGDPGEQEPQS